jgi:hypothetical protein
MVKPVTEVENCPVPAVVVDLLFDIVGLGLVLQQAPRAVIAAPASAGTFPQQVTEFVETAVKDFVSTTGSKAVFTQLAATINKNPVNIKKERRNLVGLLIIVN